MLIIIFISPFAKDKAHITPKGNARHYIYHQKVFLPITLYRVCVCVFIQTSHPRKFPDMFHNTFFITTKITKTMDFSLSVGFFY